MFQVIVDECGMCKEAECLVPIVSCRPLQVVLVGDHKQLQPVILNKTAQGFGLDRSLFDRYATQAHMLTIQYRMVCSLTVHLFVCHAVLVLSCQNRQFYCVILTCSGCGLRNASTSSWLCSFIDACMVWRPVSYTHLTLPTIYSV